MVPGIAGSFLSRQEEVSQSRRGGERIRRYESFPVLNMSSPPGLTVHSLSWPSIPPIPRREVRPPAAVFNGHRAGNAEEAVKLLDLLERPTEDAPMDPEEHCSQAVVNLAKKGRKFAEALLEHRDFATARQVMRSHRRAMTYNRVNTVEPAEEYDINLKWYRGRVKEMKMK